MTRPIDSMRECVLDIGAQEPLKREKASYEKIALWILRCLGASFLLLDLAFGRTLAFTAFSFNVSLTVVGMSFLLFGYWDEIFSRMPEKVATVALYIKSFVTDLFFTLPFGIAYLYNFERLEPKQHHEGETPLLLVHGFCGHSSNWALLYRKLRKEGFRNIYFVNLGHPFKTMEAYLEIVRNKVLQIKEKTKQNHICLAGHSMGSVLLREYVRIYAKEDDVHVEKNIAIAGPLNGTKVSNVVAKFLPAPVLRDMSYKTPFITQEMDSSARESTRHLFLVAKHDCLVYPSSSSIDTEAPNREVLVFDSVGHLRILAYTKMHRAFVDFMKS